MERLNCPQLWMDLWTKKCHPKVTSSRLSVFTVGSGGRSGLCRAAGFRRARTPNAGHTSRFTTISTTVRKSIPHQGKHVGVASGLLHLPVHLQSLPLLYIGVHPEVTVPRATPEPQVRVLQSSCHVAGKVHHTGFKALSGPCARPLSDHAIRRHAVCPTQKTAVR